MCTEQQKLENLFEKFIADLTCEKFDFDLKKYLSAIKYLAEIDILELDDEKYMEKIDENIDDILTFIAEYKNNYHEIKGIQGFRKYDRNSLSRRDYYYYIADQQVKASIYYVRYLNFLEQSQLTKERKDQIINKLNQFKRLLIQNNLYGTENAEITSDVDLHNECENLINKIELLTYESITTLYVENTSNEKQSYSVDIEDIKQQCIRYLDEIKLSIDIEYKKYMMFNNMMREIRFFGTAYQYLWHWKKEKKTLYRCGTLESILDVKPADSKENCIKNMFQDCIDHMNSPSKIRHSYSENLLLDIYKYLTLEKMQDTDENNEEISTENGIRITSYSFKNNNTTEFNIIKDAEINSIFVDNEAKSFHEFIIGKDVQNYDLPYIVEMYPQSLKGKRNSKGTIKGMRDWLLPIYFNSWGIDCTFSKTKIADDKEVITYGECYSNKVNVDEYTKYTDEEFNSGTLFSMTLDKEDVIYLLLKIFKQREDNLDNLTKKIVENLCWISMTRSFGYYYNNNIDYTAQIGLNKSDASNLVFKVVIDGAIFGGSIYKNEDEEKISVELANKICIEHVKSKIEKYLKERYARIDAEKHFKSDFILSTMPKGGYCFNLVKEYNEYLECDEEIRMLKYLIFKE